MKQYEPYELVFHVPEVHGTKADIDLSATFTNGDTVKKVWGFYAGENTYIIRFLPEKAGLWKWNVCGIINSSGQEDCIAVSNADSGRHGVVHAKGTHFFYQDGTPYYPFGTTVYALLHQEKPLVDTTMETLAHSAFNKVRFCIFPKHFHFNSNEPELFAFEKEDGEWDVHKPCLAFWTHLENRIAQLNKMGIQCDIILFHPYDRWGFAKFSKTDSLVYIDYCIRRLSSFPNVWWSLANEYDLLTNYCRQDWKDFARYISENDPYSHLLSNHNCFNYWDFSLPYATHCSIQDSCMEETLELIEKYNKPVIFDECCYEGNLVHNWGNISAKELVHRFWTAVVYGGYCTHGETYYHENEVLWWAKGGIMYGESPARIGFLKQIVESLPGPLDYCPGSMGKLSALDINRMKANGIPAGIANEDYVRRVVDLPDEMVQRFLNSKRNCVGHCGDEAYLRYYGQHCAAAGEIELPEDKCYTVEIIDTWEMTRKVAAEGISGKVEVGLPGKEGMAILATRIV